MGTAFKKIWPFLGLYLSLAVPSLGDIQKYSGGTGMFLYAAAVFFTLFSIYKHRREKILSGMSDKEALAWAAITVACLIAIFFIVYPVVNSGAFGGGSDRDESLNLAASKILRFQYPYYQKTYLGNPITPMPGSVLFSAPFFLLGNSAFQNFFWLIAFFVVSFFFTGAARQALFIFWLVLFLSPVSLREFVTGGDLLANNIFIVFFMFFMLRFAGDFNAKRWKKILFCILMGIGFSSRANFILLLPLLFSALVQNAGWRSAVKYASLTIVVFLAVTLPFYLYDPKGFSPLSGQFHKVDEFYGFWPGIFICVSGSAVSLALSFQRMKRDCLVLFRNCAIVQFFPALSLILLHSISQGKPNFILSAFGMNFLFFGTFSFWRMLMEEPKSLK